MENTKLDTGIQGPNPKEAFKHVGLDDFEIRLVKIRPGYEHDEVRCHIHHFDYSKAPPFIALSYRWGTAAERIPIQIGTQMFDVMSNAWWALHYLRRYYLESYIWLDAICINQTNYSEKNLQVECMGNIFSKAKEVVCWLGLEDEGTKTAFDSLRCAETYRGPTWGFQQRVERSSSALWRLLQRDYWSRLWIVQEIVLARNLTLMCGKHLLSWNFLEMFISNVKANRDHILMRPLRGIENLPVATLVAHRRREHRTRGSERDWRLPRKTLLYLLSDYRDCGCLDPRDKIYGLVGLFNDQAIAHFKVNYDRNLENLLLYTLAYLSPEIYDTTQLYSVSEEVRKGLGVEQIWGFQSWNEHRLRLARRNNVSSRRLFGNELDELPSAVIEAEIVYTITAPASTMPSTVSLRPADLFRAELAVASTVNEHILTAPCFAGDGQATDCPDLGSTHGAWEFPIEGLSETDLEPADFHSGPFPKALCDESGLVAFVCAATQAGDILCQTVEVFEGYLRHFVIRPSTLGYSVVGHALMNPVSFRRRTLLGRNGSAADVHLHVDPMHLWHIWPEYSRMYSDEQISYLQGPLLELHSRREATARRIRKIRQRMRADQISESMANEFKKLCGT